VDLVVLDLGPDRGQRRLAAGTNSRPDLETALEALGGWALGNPEFHCL